MQATPYKSILITGAGGYIGRQLVAALSERSREFSVIVATDLNPVPPKEQLRGIKYLATDICSKELVQAFEQYEFDLVVHLAAMVTPGFKSDRNEAYKVDVLGTENVLNASLSTGVKKLIYTSSGAAYGYHADNPIPLKEDDALRGNQEFSYSYHKRLVEEMLARYRNNHPELKQLIFRPGFVLGTHTKNQITNLFKQKRIIGLKGTESPFVIIWDQDVVGAIVKGIFENGSGIFNLAGDGTLTLSQMARLLQKPCISLPVWLVKVSLWIGKRLKLTQYGPEQIGFLRYRPVLDNRRLKEVFGFIPQKTTREVFDFYLKSRRHGCNA